MFERFCRFLPRVYLRPLDVFLGLPLGMLSFLGFDTLVHWLGRIPYAPGGVLDGVTFFAPFFLMLCAGSNYRREVQEQRILNEIAGREPEWEKVAEGYTTQDEDGTQYKLTQSMLAADEVEVEIEVVEDP